MRCALTCTPKLSPILRLLLAIPLLCALPDRAAGAPKISSVSLENGEFHVVVEDAEGASNVFSLQHSPDLSSTGWEGVPGAGFIPIDSTHCEFSVPTGGLDCAFFRVVGSFLSGAPSTMNQIQGGTLPAISSPGGLDVASFFMARTEATWAEWRAIRTWATANGYDIGNAGAGCGDGHPVYGVSWFDALKWCNARSEQAGLSPVYTVAGAVYRTGEVVPYQSPSADGYRLPTEAEWEFAARGGTQSQGYAYSGGNDMGTVGRYSNNSAGAVCDLDSGRGTWAVGQEQPNELGQYDMSGNVWEWCWDAVGELRRIRGGSWADDAASASLSTRSAADPASRLDTIGFRPVRKVSSFAPNQRPVVTLLPPVFEPYTPGRLFVIGDSTVANYGSSQYPWRGWGQELQQFFHIDRITVHNRARGGRSSKSFIVEGLWDAVKAELVAGDYLLIQWGHNDRDWTKPERYTTTTEYKGYLTQYIDEARALGVRPIFVTPMVMNAWTGSTMRNVFTEPGNNYAGAMKEVAATLSVPLVDLNLMSYAFFSVLDYDTCGRYYFNTYLAGEYPNYPSGNTDGTHFQEMGALTMAKFITQGLRQLDDDPLVGKVADGLKPQYPVSIKANIPSAGRVTVNTGFPEGVTFTLKALSGSGHTFMSWKDGSNTTVSTNSLTTFQVPAQASTYIAYFDNTTPVAPPVPGTTIPGGVAATLLQLTADAFDPDGSIARVEYHAMNGSNKVGESTTPPYSLGWEYPSGAYAVWAEAVDNVGNRSNSLLFQVDTTVSNAAPTVTLTGPAQGSSFPARSDVTLTATASDSDGTVAKVAFYVDGILHSVDTAAPYAAEWHHVPEGAHALGVRSFDNLGLNSSLAISTVTVVNPNGGPLLQEAEAGTRVGSFTVVADAAASGGQAVEAVSGPADTNYVEFRFNVPAAGTYVLRTKIKAVDGNHDSMFVSVDGAAADQYLWDTARSTSYIEDFVANRDGLDPVLLNLSAGTHVVRFGYRENLFLDLVELQLAP